MLKYRRSTKTSAPSGSSDAQNPVRDRPVSDASSGICRTNSTSSLSSIDSSDGEWGVLRVHTCHVRSYTDYKTIRVSSKDTVQTVLEAVLSKFKLSCRDPNLFELWMEVNTKRDGESFSNLLKLDRDARPLDLQWCLPANMCRFFLHQHIDGILVRIHDSTVCPQSNYKSVILSPRTPAREAAALVLQLDRLPPDGCSLWVTGPEGEAEIPPDAPLAPLAQQLTHQYSIVLRPIE